MAVDNSEKLDAAERGLLAKNPAYMPTMAEFRKEYDLSLEELGAIVSRNTDIGVKMTVKQPSNPSPMPEPTARWEDALERISTADLKGIFRRKMSAIISLFVSEVAEHVNASGTNGIHLSGPVDVGELLVSEYPEFYFIAEVRKEHQVNDKSGEKRVVYKYDIQGEWKDG